MKASLPGSAVGSWRRQLPNRFPQNRLASHGPMQMRRLHRNLEAWPSTFRGTEPGEWRGRCRSGRSPHLTASHSDGAQLRVALNVPVMIREMPPTDPFMRRLPFRRFPFTMAEAPLSSWMLSSMKGRNVTERSVPLLVPVAGCPLHLSLTFRPLWTGLIKPSQASHLEGVAKSAAETVSRPRLRMGVFYIGVLLTCR